jgi:predicted AlkP superfamily phosphohydrolase/phosphomutase
MPRLKALRNSGLTGRTRYGAPVLLTPQMWATVLTGRSAASHGVFDYWQRSADGRAFREMHGDDIRGARIWDELDRSGLTSGFVNVPMTFPPAKTSGFMISGQDAPGPHASIAFPKALYVDLVSQFGRYHHKDIFPGFEAKGPYARTIAREVSRQSMMFAYLARRTDWRFLLLYSSGTAFAQHYFWADMENPASPLQKTIADTYAASDQLIGSVASALDQEDALMVISECGGGPIRSGVRLNAWLEAEGFLVKHRAAPSSLARALAAARRAAPRVLPKWALPAVNRPSWKALIQARIAGDGIDWSKTAAFHRGKGEGNIYINRSGGPVGPDPDQYEAVRSDIIARLAKLKDPTSGEFAVARVWRREELYAGPALAAAPDLFVEWRDFAYMPSEDIDREGKLFGPRFREYMTWPTSGSHRREGFLLAHGKRIRAGVLEQPMDLADLAPTWMQLLGQPVPAAMEGRSRAAELALSDPTAPAGPRRRAANSTI